MGARDKNKNVTEIGRPSADQRLKTTMCKRLIVAGTDAVITSWWPRQKNPSLCWDVDGLLTCISRASCTSPSLMRSDTGQTTTFKSLKDGEACGTQKSTGRTKKNFTSKGPAGCLSRAAFGVNGPKEQGVTRPPAVRRCCGDIPRAWGALGCGVKSGFVNTTMADADFFQESDITFRPSCVFPWPKNLWRWKFPKMSICSRQWLNPMTPSSPLLERCSETFNQLMSSLFQLKGIFE